MENRSLFIVLYVLIFAICFFIGALTANSKRGRYLDKNISEVAVFSTLKVGFAFMSSILSLYVVITNKNNIDNSLLLILGVSFIIIIFVEGLLYNKIRKSKTNESSDNQKLVNNEEKNVRNDKENESSSNNEMLAISETAICNGILVMQIFSFLVIIFVYANSLENFINIITNFKFGNVFLLLLFNSLVLLIFSSIRFMQFLKRNNENKEVKSNSYDGIVDFLNEHVDN